MKSIDVFKRKIELNSIALLDGFLTFNEFMKDLDSIYIECNELYKKEIIATLKAGVNIEVTPEEGTYSQKFEKYCKKNCI